MAPLRILIAAPHATQRKALVDALCQDHGPEMIATVETGAACLKSAEETHFDCILLDTALLGLPTEEILQRLSKLQTRCPVIALSSALDQDAAVKAFRDGATDFIRTSEALEGGLLQRRIRDSVERNRQTGHAQERLVRHNRRLAVLAERDPLTNLFNRRVLGGIFSGRRQIFDRRGAASIVICDIDHFKRVNDRHGHTLGDQVLREVARRLQVASREQDIVCRWGGEEFLIILNDREHHPAILWAEHLRTSLIESPLNVGGHRISLTASFGVFTDDSRSLTASTIQKAIEQSDQCLYLAKEMGRNRVIGWPSVKIEQTAQEIGAREGKLEDRLDRFLGAIAEQVGPTTVVHMTEQSRRVADCCIELASRLRVPTTRMPALTMAALMHDLGKCHVSDQILAKPGPLSDDERTLIGHLADDAARLARSLGAGPEVAEIIRHQRSPAQLRGHRIKHAPSETQILTVASAFVAMTSARPYQTTKTIQSALDELAAKSGAQFEADVVCAAASVFGNPTAGTVAPTPAAPTGKRSVGKSSASAPQWAIDYKCDRPGDSQGKADRRRSPRWLTNESLKWRLYRDPHLHDGEIVERSLDGFVLEANEADMPPVGARIVLSDSDDPSRRGFRAALVRRTEATSAHRSRVYAEILS